MAKQEVTNQRETIISLKAALDFKGETEEQFAKRCEHDDPFEKSVKEIAVFANAMRSGKELTNKDTWFFPWHYRSGSGFSYLGWAGSYTVTDAYVGSRLCVFTREDAIHMAKCLPDTFHVYLSGNVKK